MGVVFGCAIVYTLTQMVEVKRQISALRKRSITYEENINRLNELRDAFRLSLVPPTPASPTPFAAAARLPLSPRIAPAAKTPPLSPARGLTRPSAAPLSPAMPPSDNVEATRGLTRLSAAAASLELGQEL